MVEKIGFVRNPLTVVAIFAGIAEVSGSVVLPFIAIENQATYIWFLMFFPFYLVTAFFLVLTFKHEVLYAPSDFKDDQTFLVLSKSTASQEEKLLKIDDEIKEEIAIQEDTKSKIDKNQVVEIDVVNSEHIKEEIPKRISAYLKAEKTAIELVSAQLGMTFEKDIRIEYGGVVFLFDAIAINNDEIYGVEVKVVRNVKYGIDSIRRDLEKISVLRNRLSGKEKDSLHLTVVVILTESALENQKFIKTILKGFEAKFSFIQNIQIYTFDELEKLVEILK